MIQAIKEIGPASVDIPETSVGFGGRKNAAQGGTLLKEAAEIKKDLPPKQIEEIASDIEVRLKRLNTELRLEIDKQSRKVIVKIVDQETSQVIRQIPSEELLAISRRMEELIGVLYNAET